MRTAKYLIGGQGRLDAVRMTPGGGNEEQAFVPEHQEGPHESDVFPLATTSDPFGKASYNLNPMLLEAIRISDGFWELAEVTTFSAVVDQIYYDVSYVCPWVPGTHGKKGSGMQSNLRGVSTTGTPGVAYTILLKLYIMKLTRTQIKELLEHTDSPYIRAIGFLYLRIGMSDGFKELWTWFEPHLGDREELQIDGTPSTNTTIGDFARRLLTDQDFFGDRFPRIPVLVQRQIDANLKTWDKEQAARPAQPPPAAAGRDAADGEEGSKSSARKRGRDEYNEDGADDEDEIEARAREREAKREREREQEKEREREREERRARAREEEREEERERQLEREKARDALKDKERLRKKKAELVSLEAKIKALREKIVNKEDADVAERARTKTAS